MKIDVTPHTSLLQKIGDASFSVSQSISELIANSFDATPPDRAAHIEIRVSTDEIVVADNGVGMSQEVLTKAVRMAWPMKDVRDYGKDGKSEFGLGMKTACASLGKWWSVTTIREDAEQGMRVAFDLEEWESGAKKWEADVEQVPRDEMELPAEATSGTIVRVKALKVTPVEKHLQEALGRAYAPHIRGNDRIFVNGDELKVPEPELIPGSRVEVDMMVEGVHIHGWGGLMRKGSLRDHGFHWYRKGQLIEEYDKSFIKRHPSYRQVIGELHADEMPVNFTKKGFEIESAPWKQARNELEEHFQPLFKEAKKKIKEQEPDPWTAGEVRDNVDVMAQVGEAMSVQVLNAEPPSDYLMPSLLEQIETVSVPEDEEIQEVARRHPIRVGDTEFRWKHRFKPLGEEGPIVEYSFDDESEIYIFSNVNSPLVDLIEDRSVLAILNVAEAITRHLVEDRGFEYTKAVAFRDRWLVNVSAKIRGIML